MAESVLTGTDPTDPNPNPGGAWHESFDADTKTWLGGMGLDKLPEREALTKVLPMYRSAEQKLGVPADQVLRLPGKDAKPEDWRSVWQKLGAPEKPEGYDFGEQLKDDKIATSFRAKAHELGVPAPMAKAITEWFTGESGALREAQEAAFDQQADADIAALKTEWGNDYDKNLDLAKRVRKAMGVTEEEAVALERAIGLKRAAQVFSKFGGALGEHRFSGGQEGGQGFGGMSPEAARARIADLRKDSEWMAKYTAGDAEKKAEFTRLNQIAYPVAA